MYKYSYPKFPMISVEINVWCNVVQEILSRKEQFMPS